VSVLLLSDLCIGSRPGYNYRGNAQEIFENFFGTSNPFATFGFGSASMPFASRLNKPGPKISEPEVRKVFCSLTELYNGCTKTFSVKRKRFNAEKELVDSTKILTITIKPGWKAGTKITFPAEGDESLDATTPDIVFVIHEQPDPKLGYVRDGNHLIYTYQISLADALSDCSLQVPTLDNRLLSFACPEVVSPYYEKRIQGKPAVRRYDIPIILCCHTRRRNAYFEKPRAKGRFDYSISRQISEVFKWNEEVENS